MSSIKIFTEKTLLRQISRETNYKEICDMDLIRKLREANKTAWIEGAGLAAIQIGIPVRFAWYIVDGKEGVLLNPKIINRWGSEEQEEGCLSIPNKKIKVTRAFEIKYITNGKKKKARGFLARLIQHEIDHMDGKLITD